MIKNSIGNITEILNMLDKDVYNAEEIRQNYQMLIDKWGEWEIIGENSAGVVVRYVDIGNALFSGLAITFMSLTFIMFVLAIMFGKIIFPLLSKHYKNLNDELVDVATLQSAKQINDMTKNKKEWF